MSIVSGTLGAILGSDAQQAATQANIQNAQALNAQNYALFQQSRGSTGSAVLPLYLPSGTEANLGAQATANFNATESSLGSPTQQIQSNQAIVNQSMPAFNQANNLVGNIFSGGLTNQMIGYSQPVQAANLALANTQKTGIQEGLNQTINTLNAQNAQQGFQGGSSFANARLLGATINANQQAAQTVANARLQNAAMVQGIQNQGVQTALANLNTPYSMTQQALGLNSLPYTTLANNYNNALGNFNFFRISPQAFQNSALPQYQPNLGAQVALNGVGAFNTGLANYFMNQNNLSSLGNYGGAAVTPQSIAMANEAGLYGNGTNAFGANALGTPSGWMNSSANLGTGAASQADLIASGG